MSLQVPQQQRLRAEHLMAHRAREMMLQPRRRRLCQRLHLIFTPAAGEASSAQICLSVIGQTGKVVEGFLTLVALVDGAGAMAALVPQQLCLAPENCVTLEASVAFERVGLQEVGFWRRSLFLMARGKLRWDIFSCH